MDIYNKMVLTVEEEHDVNAQAAAEGADGVRAQASEDGFGTITTDAVDETSKKESPGLASLTWSNIRNRSMHTDERR